VEKNRGTLIPDWAYRDVLFMLVHYSIASFELMQRKLTTEEKEDVFQVFYRVGNRMNLKGLPMSFDEWIAMREDHLKNNLVKSNFTIDLYRQYKKHLGLFRYKILLESQVLVVPPVVNQLLRLGNISWLTPVLGIYKFSRKLKLDWFFKSIILPPEYRSQVKELDMLP
jgi:hypothetical protein